MRLNFLDFAKTVKNNMNKIILSIIGIIILGGILFALNKNTNSSQHMASGKLQVTASFYPMYFFASQIGGDKVQVYNITPASAEPHDYEPTTQDIARIDTSNILVLNGGALEAWGTKIKSELSGRNVVVVTAGDGVANK